MSSVKRSLTAVTAHDEGQDALFQGLVQGEAWAADELFRRFAPLVASVLVNALGQRPELPDLVNDVFVMALRDVERVKAAHALKAWLTSVAVNVCRVFLRGQRRRWWLRFFAPDALPDTAAPAAEAGPEAAVVHATYEVLGSLPAEERLALSLHYLEGLSLAEVAEAMRVSLATAKRRLQAARLRFEKLAREDRRLQEWLEEHP